MNVRSTRTGRPLTDARAIRRAVATREAYRPTAPVPGRGGQAQNGPHRMIGKKGTDMRSSRVLSPPAPHYPVSRVVVTGGHVPDADATPTRDPAEYRTNIRERRAAMRKNRKRSR